MKTTFAVLIILVLIDWVIFNSVYASRPAPGDIIINNYYDSPDPGSTSLTGGLSDNEIAQLLTIGVAAGSHQFDFSTTDWQGSITGAWYDDEDAVSFGVAKKFSESFMPNVLLHGNYTQNGGEDLVVIGGTFRF